MMSGAQYHITYSQIFESQRRLNLSNIPKLFSVQQNKSELSIKQFIRTFSPTTDEFVPMSCAQYSVDIYDLNSIDLDIHVLQAIVFIGGYAVHLYLKPLIAIIVINNLLKTRILRLQMLRNMTFVRYINRGSL